MLWKNRGPDFALSLGTGTSHPVEARNHETKTSPITDGCVPRLFRSFMGQLDGEKTWTEFTNTLSIEGKGRYHRLNISFPGREPQLDDVTTMSQMKASAIESIKIDPRLRPVLDSIVASLFYFELQSIPHFSDGEFHCFGHIYCRLKDSSLALDRLVRQLIQTRAKFVVRGRPVQCVEPAEVRRNALTRYKRAIRFSVTSLHSRAYILIRGITSRAKEISGFPMSVAELIALQSLDTSFGRDDHATKDMFEKPLPELPVKKRKRQGI